MPKGPKKPERGVVWPKDKKGGRSTSSAGKAIIAASLAGIGSDKATAAAEKCAREKNWRFGYIKHFETLVRRSLDSPAAALASAKAGVEAMHSMFEFVGDDGAVSSFADLMASPVASSFKTGTVKGKGAMPKTGFTMPYKGEDLSGAALKQQLDRWAAYGTVEPDCAASLKTLVDDPSLLDLSGQTFVCIGAGSAMGPYPYLLSLGAHVIAVDIPGAWGERPTAMWQRLLDTAARSPGTVTFPKAQTGSGSDASLAGCDLMTQPHHILHWLKAECTKAAKKGSVTVGNYTYLDGELHVKLSICADAIMSALVEHVPSLGLAFLCTPSDCLAIPAGAHQAAKAASGFSFGKPLETFFNLASMGKVCTSNTPNPVKPTSGGAPIPYVNALVSAQGPSYALAKRLQIWRAMLAWEAGRTVVSTVAPSTATASVLSNKTFGWAYGGMPYFKPMEVFMQETTSAVMCGLLVHDVRNPKSPKNPANRKRLGLDNAMQLFSTNSAHGGVWRCAYSYSSIGEISAVIHFLGGPDYFLLVAYAACAATTFAVLKLAGQI